VGEPDAGVVDLPGSRLTAELADLWQTAWFGLPDERYRGRHADLLAACAAVGRDPATLAD